MLATSATPVTLSPGESVKLRNRRIRELIAAGWSNAQIGAEVGLSDERIRQIRAAPDPEERLAEAERALRAEHAILRAAIDDIERRRRTVARALQRIEEEREDRRIDRILGLTG
ncbi:MAG: hypothetical protein AB1627_00955 [Chloroflexota bacterium]